MKKLAFSILFFLGVLDASGQELNYRTLCRENVEDLREWYDQGAYLLVRDRSALLIEQATCDLTSSRDIQLLHTLSICYIALLSDADIRLSAFSIAQPHTRSGTISSEYLTWEKFGNEDWESALEWFERPHYFYSIEIPDGEWRLAHGYVLFQLGRFERAIAEWNGISQRTARYYYPARYYTALAYANQESLGKAIEIFKSIDDHPAYREDIPYYLAQIYYEEKRYEEVLDVAQQLMGRSTGHYDIFRLAGLSAYELHRHQQTTEYLDQFIHRSPAVDERIYYIAGLSAYQQKKWNAAQDRFTAIAHLDSELGQLSNYYLADIGLKTGDKAMARNAFATAYRMEHVPEISEECIFFYGKLSAELRYDRDAIVHLREFKPSSKYYTEAQQIMSNLLLSTRDYSTALQTLATIPSKGEELKKAEHRIMLQLGLQYLSEGKSQEAENILESTALKTDSDEASARARFWLGELAYNQGELSKASRYYMAFLNSIGKGFEGLAAQAHYSLGYIAIKEDLLMAAIRHFEKALGLGLDAVTEVDSETRLGDLYLSINDYDKALSHYDNVISQHPEARHDYALYQKAIVLGLKNEPVKKLITLETIIDEYRSSQYLDDALYESGVTLQMMNKPNEALTSFRFLVDEFEGTSSLVVPSLLRMALISYNQGDVKQSADYYRVVFDNLPEPAQRQEALTGLREIYVNDLTRPDVYLEIEEEFGKGKPKDLRRDSLTFASAHRQFELANFDRAVEAFEQYLSGYPNGQFATLAYYEMGLGALATENFEVALSSLDTVCMTNPARFGDACFKAAEIAYNYSNDFETSGRLYQRSFQYSENQDEKENALIGALRSAHRTNNDSLQLLFAERVLAIEKISVTDRVFAHYCLAKSRISTGKDELAIDDLNFVIANSAGELAAESRFLVARIYFDNEELLLAEKICDQANKMNVGHPYWVARGLILYSDILKATGDLFNARAALEAVVQNATDFPEIIDRAKSKLQEIDQQLNQENKLDHGSED